MGFAAIVVAGGAGRRAGEGAPKQWRPIGGRPMALWSVEAFARAGAEEIVLVAPASDRDEALCLVAHLAYARVVAGGAERVDSVLAGLAALETAAEIVMVHDAARPFLDASHIEALTAALASADGALPALAVADTLKRRSDSGASVQTSPRDGLFRAQTPQAFRRERIMAAYAAWPTGETPTDDAQVMERFGGRVALTPGDPRLMKLTYPEDFEMAELLAGSARVVRTGLGVDAHRFGPGSSVWLCGVEIPHTATLIGHSDADAGLHALTDAILGAIGEGDIGDHFPPSDPQWKGAASDIFLKRAVELVRERGGRILNADVTLICEHPKVKPHRLAMRERLAELLELPLDRISVKATTMEAMGFTGREEGLASQAVATVETPA